MSKKMISISTKTGDTGTSGLANGERLSKDMPIFSVIGDIDELNSWLGLIVAKCGSTFEEHKQFLLEIQDTLFYIGAELAQSPTTKLSETALAKLEEKATTLQQSLKADWHTKFILPGGTELGAWIDISRAVCRRSERTLIQYNHSTSVSPVIKKYINRLSDYLYLLRCFINHSVEYSEKEFLVQK